MIRFFEQFPEVIAGFSSRDDGNLSFKYPMADDAREKFMRSLGLDITNLVTADQPHGNNVAVVRASDRGLGAVKKDWLVGYDALVTDDNQVTLGICTADCVPVFIFFPQRKVIAACHFGWRCIVSGLLFNLAKILKEQFYCQFKDAQIAIGPHIGACCFEVKEDVIKAFINYQSAIISRGDKTFIDLSHVIKAQLLELEFNPENLEENRECTMCNQKYFSYRREKINGMMGVISLNK
jgi:hypothetical protein